MTNQPVETATLQSHSDTAEHYDITTIQLHWVTAILVLLLWGIGQVIDFFPRGEPRIMIRSVHILFGVMLALVLVTRIFWRSTTGRKLPAAEKGLAGLSARIVHFGLYQLLIAVVLLGLTNVWMRGDSIFALFDFPRYASADKATRHLVGNMHGLFADSILIVAGLHALAALAHHYVFKDNVLRRMLPWK